jgi:pSer/pThr/pTyr-binding forkhead associated (FHA) protein
MLDVVISSKGNKSRQTFWELGRRLVVGRAGTCDVVVADIEMSRQHFILEWENGGIFVTDLGSTNGTAVNGTRIFCKRRLEPGDHIEAGSGNFTIRW